ncbi:MAG: ROK family transcriptional regulator [Anaerolineae bacterium]|nr:ROK family transcriptional regulator [Anaerolineae bacterium]
MASRHQIPAMHRAAILAAIRSEGPISRAELARRLHLRPSSVTEQVRELMSEGLICEVGQGGSDGGRPPVLLDIARAGNYAIGITLEPRGIAAALVQWDGTILARAPLQSVDAGSSPETLEDAAIAVTEEVLADAAVPLSSVHTIGVGVSALVDTTANEAIFSSTFSELGRFRFDRLAEHFGKPVYLEDIAYLMALGERWFVYPKDPRPLVFLLISSGTCGAVLSPAGTPELPRFAAEFGHMVLDADGPICGCGRRGCLEAFVSETALVATANRLLGAPGHPPLGLEEVARLVHEGNPVAQSILSTAAEHLGLAVASISSIFAPALLVLGGSVVEAWRDQLVPQVRAHARSHLLEFLQDRVEIVPSQLGSDAALLGSAARALDAAFVAPRLLPV